MNRNPRGGFTLIELSIVLVIIGLIVGGILVGQDLIRAAGERAQISQIEKFNTATNTFRDKYGCLPGDIADPAASSFGFQARGNYAGTGNCDGVIQGIDTNGGPPYAAYSYNENGGETLAFWADLAQAHLIEGSYAGSPTAGVTVDPTTPTSTPPISAYIPTAKIGSGEYVYVWSGGVRANATGVGNSVNYFGLSAATQLTTNGGMYSGTGLTAKQAYDIDAKTDDGFPQTGRVTAIYLNQTTQTSSWVGAAGTGATGGNATTCYDNGSSAGVKQHYSIEISGGSNPVCALSFQLQAGD